MRILLLSNLYPPYVDGGAEILAGDVATGLEQLGHKIIVLTSSHGLPKVGQDDHIWRTLHLAPSVHFDRQRSLWQQLNQLYHYYRRYHYSPNAAELRRAVAVTKPDVLYIWEIAGLGVNSLLKTLPDLGVPVVFHLGGYLLLYARSPETDQSQMRMRWLKKRLIGTVPSPNWTSLIAVSATVKQGYVEAGFDPERIEVIHNGIDQRFLELPRQGVNKGSSKEGFQLLFVGRLRIEKGILVLLKALDLLINEYHWLEEGLPAIHLNIFGTGDQVYINELQDFLSAKRLTQLVTFHGKISQDELIRQYDCSDIMLVPSVWQEPFGLVVVEAMARGLPVIASNIGGPTEILTHERNGLLIEPGDERALALAIKQLLENPDKRMQFGQAGRATVRQHFTIQENARRVAEHLQRAIGGSRTGSNVLSGIEVL